MTNALDLVPEIITSFRDAPPDPQQRAIPRRRQVPTPLGPSVQVPGGSGARADLLTVLRRRRSERFYGADALPLSTLTDVVSRGVMADRGSWPDEQEQCPLETFAVAFRVAGLEPGIFGCDSSARSYTPVASLPPAEKLEGLTLQSEFCHSAVIISIAGDLTRAAEIHGGHGYRTLMSRAGAAAYTMWLDAVAQGWVGSVFAGFIPASVRVPLLSDGTSRHQLFALALGAPPAPLLKPAAS
jgi:hypothetical protein